MARNTINLHGTAREKDYIAEHAIRPGSLVEISPSDANAVQKHSSAGGAALPMFVREQHERSAASTGGVDNNIAAGDTATVLFPGLGDVINCVTADTIAAGEWVESDGTGGVRLFGSGYRVGVAHAASDLSGTVGRVEVIIAPIGL